MHECKARRIAGQTGAWALATLTLAVLSITAVLVLPGRAAAVPEDSPVVAAASGTPGWVPEAERGEGTGSVRVRLRIAGVGGAASGRVRLWRLSVPESTEWLGGDQIQAEAAIPDAGALIEGLPHGRYRIEVASQGASRADPPEFTVGAEPVSQTVDVHPLARVLIRLRIFRTDGEEVLEALRYSPGRRLPWTRPWSPAWAEPRRARNAPSRVQPFASSGGSAAASAPRRDDDGFRVGTRTELARDADREGAIFITCPAREFWVTNHVYVPIGDVRGEATTFVAVVPDSPDQIQASVRDAGGDVPKSRTVSIFSRAIAVDADEADTAWRRAPIHVNFEARSLARLHYVWTVETADEIRTLPPAPE